MDKSNLASILVALIALAAALLTGRSSNKAAIATANTNSRSDLEKEAYERARSYDTETFNRHKIEITELRQRNDELEEEIQQLRVENAVLRDQVSSVLIKNRLCEDRISRLERLLPRQDDMGNEIELTDEQRTD